MCFFALMSIKQVVGEKKPKDGDQTPTKSPFLALCTQAAVPSRSSSSPVDVATRWKVVSDSFVSGLH